MHPDDAAAALAADPSIKAVISVEPGYMGVTGDVRALAAVTKAHGALLMVDQAWAAHYGWHAELPKHAIELGADMMTMSIHKVLPGYSAAAVALARTGSNLTRARLEQAFECTHTTSPPGATLASIDACRAIMTGQEGHDAIEKLLANVRHARSRLLEAGVPTLSPEDFADAPGTCFDPCKLVLHTGAIGVDGVVVERTLLEAGTPVEMADRDHMVAMMTVCDDRRAVDRLVDALVDGVRKQQTSATYTRPAGQGQRSPALDLLSVQPQRVVSMRDAFFAETDTVPASEAVGRVSADLVAPYPPGVAVLAPGELITKEIVDGLAATRACGVRVAYASDSTLATYRVLR